jgi:type II secretory pathway pseudopilin PulG
MPLPPSDWFAEMRHRAGAALCARLSAERGSMLIEVMVGAIVLAIATAAVLDGIDGAQDTGARNKQRSVAATLAQQDIERLRAMPVTALSNFSQTRNVDVTGVSYTIASRTDWVRDASGVVSCTDDSAQAEYLKVTSSASSPASSDMPVTETTLLTPPPGAFSTTVGTAAVKLSDRLGKPLAGITVRLTGPQSLTGTTNDLGCAIFGHIPAGDYSASGPTGYVSWNGEEPASSDVTVGAGKTSLTNMEIERPGSLKALFKVPAGDAKFFHPVDYPNQPPVTAKSISVAHAKLPGGFKVFSTTNPTCSLISTCPTSLVAGNLFPHLDGYGVYAGSCEANNPAFWESDYFHPGGPGYVQLEPGDFEKTVDVYLAALKVRVTRSTSFLKANLRLDQFDDRTPEVQCHDPNVVKLSRNQSPTEDGTTNKAYVFTVAVPLGNYEICVDNDSRRKTIVPTTSPPADPNPADPGTLTTPVNKEITIDLTSGTTSGTCASRTTLP